MSNKLGMRRVSARWVPCLLLPEQMGVRVKMCNEYWRQYNDEGDTFLNRVVSVRVPPSDGVPPSDTFKIFSCFEGKHLF